MYKSKPGRPIENDKCFACRYCVWDAERKEECCENFRCFELSDFVEYRGEWDEKHQK